MSRIFDIVLCSVVLKPADKRFSAHFCKGIVNALSVVLVIKDSAGDTCIFSEHNGISVFKEVNDIAAAAHDLVSVCFGCF